MSKADTFYSDTPYSLLPTVEGTAVLCGSSREYPGLRRIPMAPTLGPDKVLVKTGGNALQAVPLKELQEKDFIAVSVPENVAPGELVFVATPDQRLVEAVVPEGALPGFTFLIHVPSGPVIVDATTPNDQFAQVVVVGHDVENNDLHLATESQDEKTLHDLENQDENLVLVQVPPGAAPGSKIQVPVPDGRTLEATVPAGNLTEFYVRVPPRSSNDHAGSSFT